MLSFAQAVALAVFASYFTLILALFWLILRSIPWQLSRRNGRRTSLYGCLALASFGHTWFCASAPFLHPVTDHCTDMIKYLLVRVFEFPLNVVSTHHSGATPTTTRT